ncbi:hypothetical protein [Brevibacterium album]|uniref:hypothetical protein n=1 Tax=Brevibacterium album TaxID=417948 RepID=UPI00041A1C98|nr:hypothetical protein [Brevibacterium album]
MTTSAKKSFHSTRLRSALASAAVAAVTLSACAGGIGGGSQQSEGEGVPYGATAEEYRAALADMPETTLTVQAGTQSPESISANILERLSADVEEASGGKIRFETHQAQTIAPYPELDAALADGRVDIAFHLPNFTPSSFPVNSAFIALSGLAPSSPRASDFAATAAISELAWNSDAYVEEFESKGLHLLDISPSATFFSMCTSPVEENSDWSGKQVRVASAANEKQVQALSAVPVSLTYLEIYEALQRNTIDCHLSSALGAVVGGGVVEVGPHISYTEEVGFARPNQVLLGGAGYAELPLAARQLIFDQMQQYFLEFRLSDMESHAELARLVRENDGSFNPLGAEVEADLREASEQLVQEQVEADLLDEDIAAQLSEGLLRWNAVIEDEGLGDDGGYEDFDTWHDDDPAALEPFAQRAFEEIALPHRPE